MFSAFFSQGVTGDKGAFKLLDLPHRNIFLLDRDLEHNSKMDGTNRVGVIIEEADGGDVPWLRN